MRRLEYKADIAYAGRDWNAAAKLYGNLSRAASASAAVKANALFRRAYSFDQLGRRADAIADYSRAIELPDAPVGQVADALRHRGWIYSQEGKTIEEKMADYSRAIELPNAPAAQVAKALLLRGWRLAQQGKRAEALADYARVIELPEAPVNEIASALRHRGWNFSQEKRFAEALADYSLVIELPNAPVDQIAKALLLGVYILKNRAGLPMNWPTIPVCSNCRMLPNTL